MGQDELLQWVLIPHEHKRDTLQGERERANETVANQASRTSHLAKGQTHFNYIIYKMRPICFKYTLHKY